MRAARIFLPLALLAALALAGFAAMRGNAPEGQHRAAVNPEETAVRILVVGDNHGDNPVYRRILRDAKTAGYDLMVNLADTSEYGLESEFADVSDLEAPLPFPVLHVVGSHDIRTDASRGTFERAFNPRYFARDIGPVHLVLLDNADRAVGFDAEQLDWLERDLAANRQPVTLVFFHRPFGLPLAEVTGDDETPASRRTNRRLLEILAAHLPAHVYAAHLHTYLPYSLDTGVRRGTETVKIPATISGGGGDPAQSVLGGPDKSFFHALELRVTASSVTERVIPAP